MIHLDTSTQPGYFNGLPYKGVSGINIKTDDIERKLPLPITEGHVRVFNTALDTDRKDYEAILEKLTAGLAMAGIKRIVYDREMKSFLVYLEWAEFSYIEPPAPDNKPVTTIPITK